jgi:thiol-disulfide isomerase/thioredoxin
MSKAQDEFKKLNIKYIPTVILFYNGEEVYRVESGISLKLPDNAIQRIEEEIEEIIDSKF